VRVDEPERDVERTITLPAIRPEPHESWLPPEHPLYRPRHSHRQRTALTCAAVFFCVPVLALAMGVRATEIENRPLAGGPQLASGWGAVTGLPQWATDNLPWRDTAVRTVDGLSRRYFGEPWPQGSRIAAARAPFAPPVSTPGSVAGSGKVIEGRDGWLYYEFDVEGKCHPAQRMDDVLANLGRLRQAVEASGRRFVLIIAPDKTTAVPEYLPDSYAGKACSRTASEEFWRRAPAEAGAVDLRDDLRRITEHDRTPPYFPQDTHWDDRGALLLVRHAAERVEAQVTAGWKVEFERTESSESDLPKLLGRAGRNVVNVYSLAPDGVRDRTQPVHPDLGVPWPMTSAPTEGMVQDRVGFLVDSFAMAATRYLPAAFANGDVVFYSSLRTAPEATLAMMVEQDAIVVEAVERDVIFGSAAIVDPAVIDQIGSAMAAHPIR
jgi:alginate O-acetyltransferase complex protein AlgJ